MIAQNIRLRRWDWDITILYDATREDTEAVLLVLEMAGADDKFLERAESNLASGGPDNGLTYSNQADRQTVMVIGRVSGPAEFWNTFGHETGHCTEHIAEESGIDHKGEEFQYLSGEIFRQSYPVAKMFICGGCGRGRR